MIIQIVVELVLHKLIFFLLPASVIHIKYGQDNAIFSGVHFEYDTSLLASNNQYLQKVIPELEKTNAIRKALIKIIFKQVGVLD